MPAVIGLFSSCSACSNRVILVFMSVSSGYFSGYVSGYLCGYFSGNVSNLILVVI